VINTNELKIRAMATPGELVEAVADVLGIPMETVTNYDRVLSENGMRSKSGRGRGAAKVTAGDAANLLIAIMGSPIAGASVKEAANTCRKYGSLPGSIVAGTNNFASLGLPMLDQLGKHTLHQGISALIKSAARGEHFRTPGLKETTDDFCGIELDGPRPWAEILADGSVGELKEFARLVYTRPWKKPVRHREGDLNQSRHTTYRTIRKLGSLLSEQGAAESRVKG
jgi:hypothetical protein